MISAFHLVTIVCMLTIQLVDWRTQKTDTANHILPECLLLVIMTQEQRSWLVSARVGKTRVTQKS